jgi:hypothetical protein
MSENTNPDAGSDATDTELTLDQAMAAYDDEPETENVETGGAEPVDTDGGDDGEAVETEDAEQVDDAPVPIETYDALVKMPDGATVPIQELIDGHFRQEDYTRKTQEDAETRRGLQTLGADFVDAMDRVLTYLASKLPPEPDPQLRFTNPTLHYQQEGMHNSALAEMSQIMQAREGAQAAAQELSQADFVALKAAEDAKIVKEMPHLKDPKRFEAFNRDVAAGAKAAGFTDAQINSETHAGLRLLAYHANYGINARAAAAKAKSKVQNASPSPLPATQRQHPNSVKALANVNAMKQLRSSGSLKDAMRMDFE